MLCKPASWARRQDEIVQEGTVLPVLLVVGVPDPETSCYFSKYPQV